MSNMQNIDLWNMQNMSKNILHILWHILHILQHISAYFKKIGRGPHQGSSLITHNGPEPFGRTLDPRGNATLVLPVVPNHAFQPTRISLAQLGSAFQLVLILIYSRFMLQSSSVRSSKSSTRELPCLTLANGRYQNKWSMKAWKPAQMRGTSLVVTPSFFKLKTWHQNVMYMENMQNMNLFYLHADFAAQQLVNISFSPGDVLWQHSLQLGRNATMDHELVPKPGNRLTRTEDIPKNEQIYVNMQNIQNS